MVHPWRPFPGPVTTTFKSKLGFSSAFLRVLIRDGEAMETVTDFIVLSSRITVDSDCSYEIKRHLLLGRKVVTYLDSILKSRDITLLTMAHLVKAMVFPVVIYGCESWTIKKAECWRIDAFELWCWRRVPCWEYLGLQGDTTIKQYMNQLLPNVQGGF